MNKLAWNDSVVDSLRSALSQGKTGLGDVPAMLKIVLKEQAWKDRVIVATGEHTSFERFEDFAKAAPLAGLGADLALIKRIVRDDPEALDLLDQATENPEGRPAGSHATMASETTVNNVNSYETRESPVGNTSQYAIRRLRKERPDLHAKVVAGELSPHRAMIEAGFRKHTVTVALDPESFAAAILRHFDEDQIDRLLELLDSE